MKRPHLDFPGVDQRHWIAVLALWALTICYMMRFCISLAITVITPHGGVDKVDPNACPNYVSNSSSKNGSSNGKEHKYLYVWSEETQGIILSSFFWGYVVTQIPGGMIADRLGAKVVTLFTVLFTSLLTIITPPAIVYGDWIALVIVRVLVGLMQGAFYASLHQIVSSWIPKDEMGIWGTVIFIGSQFGNALSFLLSGLIISAVGEDNWGSIFYIYGCVGILWTVTCFFMVYASPQEHPNLKPKEKEILDRHISESSKTKGVKKTPIKSVMKSLPNWAIIMGQIGHDWGFFALTTDLPKYFKSVMMFNVQENGLNSSLGYFFITAMAIGGGWVVDYFERKHVMPLKWNRVLFTTLGSLPPSLGIVASAYTNCDRTLAVVFLVMGVSFMGLFYPGCKLNPIDLSPNHAGFVGAVSGAIGSMTGIIVPYLIGVLTPDGFLSQWRLVFWITFGVMSATNIFYAIFASADVQPWNSEGVPTEETDQK